MASGGKGARSRSKDKRKKLKASRKAAQRALYKSWADGGDNSKRKNIKRKRAVRLVRGKRETPESVKFVQMFPPKRLEERREDEHRFKSGLFFTMLGVRQINERLGLTA